MNRSDRLAPFVGTGADVDVASVERIVVWLPPLLGSATVVVTYGWMRRHFGFGRALTAAVFLAVLSGSSHYAEVGMLDHHVVVALLGSPPARTKASSTPCWILGVT